MRQHINLFTLILAIPGLLWKGILEACATTCEKQDIGTDANCNVRGGLKCAFYAKEDEIDWDSTEAVFDSVTCTINSFVMMAGGTFCRLNFARKTGKYDFTYTRDNDFYELIIQMIFEGKSATTAKALCNMVGCCNLILVLFDNNCQGRVVGKEWDGETFTDPLEGVRIERHLDSSGEFGGEKARDEIDFSSEQTCTPLFIDMAKADFEAAYVA